MLFQSRKESIILLVGDLIILLFSLWLMVFIRYEGLDIGEIFFQHLTPFSILFVFWILTFFIAGLYEKHTSVLKSKLPNVILNAQIFNIFVAITFFYLIPYFGITPKTNLFIYIAISLFFILVWRLNSYKLMGLGKKEKAILIGSGEEMRELKEEVQSNYRYTFSFVWTVDVNEISNIELKEEIINKVNSDGVTVIVADFENEKVRPALPHFYNLIFSKVKFIDMHRVYEEIFDRVPLSLVKYNWFLENVSGSRRATYDSLKRLMDMSLALLVGLISLIFYPFIYVAIKLDDGGPAFFTQDRIGENNRLVKIIKFRSMRGDEITAVGEFLRKSRLDELPQLWNVIKGDLSLVGPRPEIPKLANIYEDQIPYYNIRHIVKPGLSGWAQIYHDNHPHHSSDVQETRVKLSYDLLYVKNRSFVLDLKISLKTLKKIISRAGK